MGAWYTLVNVTKKEQISFHRLPMTKDREIAGNPAGAAITTWYLLQNQGDCIGFISDYDRAWPFKQGSLEESCSYKEVTDEVVDALIAAGILRDEGIEWIDEDDPELFLRRLVNTWMDPPR